MGNENDSFKSAVEKRLSVPTPMPVPAQPVKSEEKQKQRNQFTKGFIDDAAKTFGIPASVGFEVFATDPERKKGLKMYADVYGTPVVEITNDGLFSIAGKTYSEEDSKLLRDNMRNYYQSLKAEVPKTQVLPTPTKTPPTKSP